MDNRPVPVPLPPLPPGWTQNTAPTGHIYYYNTNTKQSTYRRPNAATLPQTPPPPPPPPSLALGTLPQTLTTYIHGSQLPTNAQPAPAPAPPFLRLSDPRVANAFMAQQNASIAATSHPAHHSGGGHGSHKQQQQMNRPKPQPRDRPRSHVPIPDCAPWELVYTKYGRRFVHNTVKNTSFWRIPEKLMPAILEMDKAALRAKAAATSTDEGAAKDVRKGQPPSEESTKSKPAAPLAPEGGYDSEYEEVEVWEDENGEVVVAGQDGDGDGDGNPPKRRRIDDNEVDDNRGATEDCDTATGKGPIEFSDADIAFQLQAAGIDDGSYGGEEDGYWYGEGAGDDNGKDGGGGGEWTEAKDIEQFQSLLEDRKVNPFGSWDTLVEEGTLVDDARYTALHTMKARRAAWETWSRAAIQARKAAQAAAASAGETHKPDPRLAFLALLQQAATPRLYWPEFKRKYRKEAALRPTTLAERDKERWYREFVARLKLPMATRKADLTRLLDTLPRAVLNNQTDLTHLPLTLTTDMRYAALEPAIRDPLVEAFLRSAGPPPPSS